MAGGKGAQATRAASPSERPGAARRPSRRERTAYHEAGHGVAAYSLGAGFARISIVPLGDTLGFCVLPPVEDHHPYEVADGLAEAACPDHGRLSPEAEAGIRSRDELEREIMVYDAGPIAEAMLAGRHNWQGAADDLRYVEALGQSVAEDPEELSAYLSWLFVRTRALLRRPERWAAVEALAAALLERGEVTGQEAEEIIARAIERFYQRAWAELPAA